MFYQYHEIVGSEKPIFETKPAGVLLYDEIPEGDFIHYTEAAYLKITEDEITLYEPLYVKVKREG
ncbi:hypothetical protein [Paenibacillus larvae]|uniref:Uncharacterized protein n=1 Tax=Paenibacillus larvae subsp. larvae TaxID=147375 RepID=A0A2L1U7F0_9BACL|nr:hypothetical protein [Paenibacillus larvae]AVF28850.1 hypothetical protein ERICIII_04847 [Paenibacillus larvae subsp. larvae]MCY9500310.1 hypothetical protein [Paenibacillus larvae]MCY9748157.1 hypothetical protein [Paenibacillus larvae]MCY9752474.1 hypothetical protein [Paenibacillus larvae]MDR5608746.1 hypothetical protein [Paenibacillus larvae]